MLTCLLGMSVILEELTSNFNMLADNEVKSLRIDHGFTSEEEFSAVLDAAYWGAKLFRNSQRSSKVLGPAMVSVNFTLKDLRRQALSTFKTPLTERGIRGVMNCLLSQHPSIRSSTVFTWGVLLQQSTNIAIRKTLVSIDARLDVENISSPDQERREALETSPLQAPVQLGIDPEDFSDEMLKESHIAFEILDDNDDDYADDYAADDDDYADDNDDDYAAADDDDLSRGHSREQTETQDFKIELTKAFPHPSGPERNGKDIGRNKGNRKDAVRSVRYLNILTDSYCSYLIHDVASDPLPVLSNPVIATAILDRMTQLGFTLLYGLTGQVADSRDDVVEDYEIRMYEACFELFIRIVAPRLPCLHSQLHLQSTPSSSSVFVNSNSTIPHEGRTYIHSMVDWSSRRAMFAMSPSILSAVVNCLYPRVYDVFAATDVLLCLVYAIEEPVRIAKLIQSMYAW
jgi:hypothetical protein